MPRLALTLGLRNAIHHSLALVKKSFFFAVTLHIFSAEKYYHQSSVVVAVYIHVIAAAYMHTRMK